MFSWFNFFQVQKSQDPHYDFGRFISYKKTPEQNEQYQASKKAFKEQRYLDGFENYLQGNIIKYIWRYNYKNGTEDLKKAQWYLNKLIEVKETK